MRLPQACLGVLWVGVSWILVHTLYTVRYAHLFYSRAADDIDFGATTQPSYTDFAYSPSPWGGRIRSPIPG